MSKTASPTLKFERLFNATPEKLWSYWTEPLRYAKWMNPAPDHGLVIHEWDLRVGGRVRFDMPQPDGNPNPQEGMFHVLNPFTELVSGSEDKSFLLRVTFEPVGKQTRMRVEVTGVPPQHQAGATRGFNACFDKLTQAVETPSVFPVGRTYAPTFTIERSFKAPVEKLWAMWTTKAGLEKWYWPEGLVAKVKSLDLRVGGGYEIAAEGLPHTSRGTFTDIVQGQRLGILAHVDFLPDVEPYDRIDSLEFQSLPDGGSKLVARATRMHNDQWNAMSALGFTSSLEKLARALEGATAAAGPPPGAKGFTIERTFRAAPEKVWKMWTTKEGIEKWWAPSAKQMGYDMRVLAMDVKVGGTFAFEMKNPEHTIVNQGVYVSVQPHTELAWMWHFDIFLAPDEKPYDVPISVTLQKTPAGGTKMTFVQGPLATPEHTEGSKQGVEQNLGYLARALGE